MGFSQQSVSFPEVSRAGRYLELVLGSLALTRGVVFGCCCLWWWRSAWERRIRQGRSWVTEKISLPRPDLRCQETLY